MSDKMVEINSVSKAFGDNIVLRSIDLTVGAGEVVCLLGPSGSGKSTLLRCVNHLERIDSGSILIDGEYIGYRERNGVLCEVPDSQVTHDRQNIGMVFQSFGLFPHMTVLDNIISAPILVKGVAPNHAKEKAIELLRKVGLTEKIDAWPGSLSGGQQQRVAMARALAMEPKLMLFDEPTSALDPELVGEVLGVMKQLADTGMTMIVVTHEIEFAKKVATNVAIMDGGYIIEFGDPYNVIDNPEHERAKQFLSKVV